MTQYRFSPSDTHWIFILLLLAIAAGGMFALLQGTPSGLGLVNDSAYYIEGADNLLAGNGYVRTSGGGELKPITHFPPLFSLLLAAFSLTGLELLPAARLLMTLLFGLTILLTGLSVRMIIHSAVWGLVGAFLLASSDVFLGVYSFALSEPLFLALMLAAFLTLAHILERRDLGWLALSGFLLSLAILTRYAGLSLAITALISVTLFLWPHPWKAVGALLAGAVPLPIAWLAYSRYVPGAEAVGNRLVSWHPPALRSLFEATKNLLTWLAPDDLLKTLPIFGQLLSLVSLLLLPALLLGLGWWFWRQHQPEATASSALTILLALQVPVYLGFLVVSLTLFDASTPLNERILSIAYLPMLVLFAGGLGWAWRWLAGHRPWLRWAIPLLALLAVAFSLVDGVAAVRQLRSEGQGFAHLGWQQSPAIQAVRDLPSLIIYTNKPTAIYLLTDRSAYITPTPSDAVTGLERPDFTSDLLEMQTRVLDGEAVLVLFGLRTSSDSDEVALYDLLSAGLPLLADYGEDVIFGTLP